MLTFAARMGRAGSGGGAPSACASRPRRLPPTRPPAHPPARPPHARPPPPQGATNFALFTGNAWGVSLCLFREEDLREGRATEEVLLDPLHNRTGDTWHVALPGLDPNLLYGGRARARAGREAGACAHAGEGSPGAGC